MSKELTRKFQWMRQCIADSLDIDQNEVNVIICMTLGCHYE